MKNLLKIGTVSWIHFENPKKQELIEISEKYDLHEIIIDDILDYGVQDKIDTYDNHIFMVFHFPKYDEKNKRYISNEFSIILGKNFIITITTEKTNHISKIREEYIEETQDLEYPEKYKISPYYILYKIIDIMYDKSIKLLSKNSKDIIGLEEKIFSNNGLNKKLLEDIMIKRRNIVFLKYIFLPQNELITEIQKTIEKFFDGQLDLYFEDLLYKLDKIENQISSLTKDLSSLNETYNSLMNVKLNSMLGVLTLLTIIIGSMTLIAGIYGMNVSLPFENSKYAFFIIMGLMIAISLMLYLLFKKKGWFE
ncbi:magnesium transporter CorA family protein [Candidatus Gracilibacteria bacterium]|nr:magnesium transporter CorA family protein [Candidatus Gracilibacteria bacterium]